MGGGGFVVDGFPYDYAYGMYPGGMRWVLPYGGSFPNRRRSGSDYFYDNVGYQDDPLKYYYVDVPVRSGASFARRRKRGGLIEENVKLRDQGASDISVDNTEFSHPDFVNSNESGVKGNASSPRTSTGKTLSPPRVVSIPVHSSESANDGKAASIVVPEAGIKRSRTGTPSERAAVLIQSNFRGCLVRRTHPLAQLKKIAAVRSELARLNEKTSDPDFIAYVRENTMGRLKLNETIMRLLLELDGVQGAHPVVRDIRKTTSKQVIALQERVDDLISGRMETIVEHQSASNLENDLPKVEDDVMAQQPAALDESETMGNSSSQSSTCEPSEDSSCIGLASQVMVPAEHDKNEEKADVWNLKKFDSISEEAATTKGEWANNEIVVTPVIQTRSEPLKEVTQKCHDVADDVAAECDPSHIEPLADVEISHGTNSKVEAIVIEENSGKQESAGNEISPAAVMKMDETMDSRDRSSEVSTLLANADTVQRESGLESSLATEAERRTCQAAPGIPVGYNNEEDKEWWIDDRWDENTTSKVDHDSQDDIAELYGDKDSPSRTLLEKATMPSTNLQKDVIPVDQAISTMPFVQESALPYDDDSQRQYESQVAKYLGLSQAHDSSDGKLLPTSGNNLDRFLGKGNDSALLFKLGKENEILKSLLMAVIKWNQMQATTMQDVNRRLDKLESRRSRKPLKVGRSRKKHS